MSLMYFKNSMVRTKDKQRINPHFLAWQMNQKPALDYFKRTAVGSRMMNIRRPTVEDLEIAIPSLHQQALIVNMYRTAMAEQQLLRALITNRNQQMEAVAAGLFRHNGAQPHG